MNLPAEYAKILPAKKIIKKFKYQLFISQKIVSD